MNSTNGINGNGNNTHATKGHSKDVFLFALNRTCSHVLCRLLSNQPEWLHSDYHFKRAFDFARDSFNWGPLHSVSDQQRQGFEKLLQEGFDEIQQERMSISSQASSLPRVKYFVVLTTETGKGYISEGTHLLHMGALQAVAKYVGWPCKPAFHRT